MVGGVRLLQNLQLLRRDERYDADADNAPYIDASGTVDIGDSWRVVEAVMHRAGSLAHQLAKRVWVYPTNQTGYPSSRPVYVYQHDAIGNVWLVLVQDGVDMELFCEFSQDAYGNPLVADGFVGSDWTTARADGITEHQTGKWIDPFTGWYMFHARWYDSETGRFVSVDPMVTGPRLDPIRLQYTPYSISENNPVYFVDESGLCSRIPSYRYKLCCMDTGLARDQLNRMIYAAKKRVNGKKFFSCVSVNTQVDYALSNLKESDRSCWCHHLVSAWRLHPVPAHTFVELSFSDEAGGFGPRNYENPVFDGWIPFGYALPAVLKISDVFNYAVFGGYFWESFK